MKPVRQFAVRVVVLVSGLAAAGCSFDSSVFVESAEPSAADAAPGEPQPDGAAGPDASVGAQADAAPAGPEDIVPAGGISQSDMVGGSGGGSFGPIACPDGEFLIGLDGSFYLGGDNGAGLCTVQVRCSKVRFDDEGSIEHYGEVSALPADSIGFCGGNMTPLPPLRCADNQLVTELQARTSGSFGAITEVQLRCATVNQDGEVLLENFTDSWGQIVGMVQDDQTTSCPSNAVAVGLVGRVGAVIDAMALGCQGVGVRP